MADELPKRVIRVGDGFFNLRGSFKIAKLIDVGSQASLVERANGRCVLLDACSLTDEVASWLDRVTERGARLEAIVHLHPFHTLHVRALHQRYPNAALYGTARHVERAPELPWQSVKSTDAELGERFGPDLAFSVPRGVDLVTADPNVHFGSVLALHPASRTLHVDDTLICMRVPLLAKHVVRLHPTLGRVLQRRAGAVAEFRSWAEELVERARELDNLCAAHSTLLLASDLGDRSLAQRIQAALRAAEGTLGAHERLYG